MMDKKQASTKEEFNFQIKKQIGDYDKQVDNKIQDKLGDQIKQV